MPPEQNRIQRVRTWPQQPDGDSHHDHFNGRKLPVYQVPRNDRKPGKRARQADNRSRQAHSRSEKSNHKAGPASSQRQAGEKPFKRSIAAVGQIHNSLSGGRGPNDHSHQYQGGTWQAAWKRGI